MTGRELKAEQARRDALRRHLSANQGAEFNAASLSRSYGLSEPVVERLVREASYG